MDLSHCTHLIIVCCHAIYLGGPTKGASEDEWLIESFQKGETPTYTQHVKAGLELLDGDPEGFLVFSGGATKKDRTALTEGESYLNLAKDNSLFSFNVPPSQIHPEIHAVDSYQNVLFSLLHFRLVTGVYPRRISVVTHEFKRRRFMEWHFPALGLRPVFSSSTSTVRVIGINPPEEIAPLEGLLAGEENSGIGLWRNDPYGVLGELAAKRRKRGWVGGMERGVFVGVGLEGVVEELVCWDGDGGRGLGGWKGCPGLSGFVRDLLVRRWGLRDNRDEVREIVYVIRESFVFV
ncbi:hypothetical protein P168DRAFT_242881 [Aspergillus campestris IBT 28561]|uniref:Uncharacterized protein n=1 Tax=Aspergillus campestris (strain IBT 28561) TaxID=1392248 RepID=A0A2I1CT28_ASPC2|nr:uncharacterized protein P168DRAFT_242881 [Aspergillus campestris IBT 28561]PKY00769.1 hypothetical protein P168DRAFT_242881 [Aspergillus campestris IBT 28561]